MKERRKRRPIEGFPGYSVTSDGLVWSNKTNRLMRGYRNARGYRIVTLMLHGKAHKRNLEILYRKAFPEMSMAVCPADHGIHDLPEAWTIIDEFPDYNISNHGRVRSERTGRLLRLNVSRGGHSSVGLMGLNPTNIRRGVTRLVADHFMEPQPHAAFDTPIHLNGDLLDCHLYNLMWRPRWFAMKYHAQWKGDRLIIPDQIADRDTGTVYDNPDHAAQVNGLLVSEIIESLETGSDCWPTRQVFELV